jgi:hypothetical protein
MRGAGYWLNPNTGKCVLVTTHDDWIRNKANADSIGLPSFFYDEIMKMKITDVDEIRIKAMEGGLVRIRNYQNYVSVQFTAQRHRVTTILWSCLVALKELNFHPNDDITITNLFLKDQVTLSLANFQKKLENDEPILREQSAEPDDITLDSPAAEKMRTTFAEYVAKHEQNTPQ